MPITVALGKKLSIMNWNEFVEKIAELYKSGKSEDEISDLLGGTLIEDSGTIERIETNSEYTPFIQLNMSCVTVPYEKKKIIGNFLCLNFGSLKPSQVAGYSKGAVINFKTRIIYRNGPFPGVSVSEFEDEKEVFIMPGTEASEIA